jgi:hypothetical protein
MCKDENSTVITQMDQILNRWKEYFRTPLNSDTGVLITNHGIQSTTTDNQTDKEILPPSYNEVCSIINKLKSNKLLCWYLHLVMVGELEYPNNPESYVASSLATGRVTLGGHVEG